MPRKDFDKFMEIAGEIDPDYEMLSFHNDIKYRNLFAKYMVFQSSWNLKE